MKDTVSPTNETTCPRALRKWKYSRLLGKNNGQGMESLQQEFFMDTEVAPGQWCGMRRKPRLHRHTQFPALLSAASWLSKLEKASELSRPRCPYLRSVPLRLLCCWNEATYGRWSAWDTVDAPFVLGSLSLFIPSSNHGNQQ